MSAEPPVDLLRLPGLRAVETCEENGNLIVTCHGPRLRPTRCCEEAEWSDNGHETARFRDFTIQKQSVWLKVERQKWQCPVCKRTHAEHIPIIQDRQTPRFATDRFVLAVALDSIEATFSAAALQHGIHETLARRIFDDYAKPKMLDYKPIMPRVLGIDEKYIKGVPHFVLGDVEHKRLLDVRPTNKIDHLRSYFSSITDRENVEIVCQDMYPGYRNIVPEFFPNAKVVTDKWHVLRAANRGVTKANRFLRRTKFKNPGQGDLFNDVTSPLKTILGEDDLAQDPSHKGFVYRYAVYLRGEFFKIYNTKDGSCHADKLLSNFVLQIDAEMRKVFSKLMKAITDNRDGILHYFDNPYTNAYIERLNGLIGAIERNGSGLRYDTLRAKALLSYGHLKADPQYRRIPGPSRPRNPRKVDPTTSSFVAANLDDEADVATGMEPDWAAIAPRGGADLDILIAVLETGTL